MKKPFLLVALTTDEILALIETLTTLQARRENEHLIYLAVVKLRHAIRDAGQKT